MRMSPRTRGQHTTAKTVAVGTSADASTHSMSKKKKAKRNKTHPKLPPLVIRRPRGQAEEPYVVAGKHTLSPEESPSKTEAQEFPKPAKQVKAGLEESRPPPLELTDDEDEDTSLGDVPPSTALKKQKAIMSHSSVGKAPLRRTETLLMEGSDIDDSSSLDNNLSHSSEVETSDYESGLSDDDLSFRDPFGHLVLENIPQRQAVVGSARPQLWNIDEAEEDVNVPSTIKTLLQDLYLQAPLTQIPNTPKSLPRDPQHAFLDSLLANKLIKEALSTAALQVPNVEDIHVRILQDHGYCVTMSALQQLTLWF
ncbi:hypothetical protein EI94DRAFT_1866005 [Lactarius quietus]|nr:hypothetical protein EI94DRAFT_1866005 [Lactarius quietus]